MKIAYLDCYSGISGDMALAALVDAGASLGLVRAALASMGLSQVSLEIHECHKNGFRAAQLQIHAPPEHVHRGLPEIKAMIESASIRERAKKIAIDVFCRIGSAEAKVHGVPIEHIHFHEVGALDSIADIVGVAVAWDELDIDYAIASAIPVGCGEIMIAHGLVRIPAPATAELLQGIPIASCDIPFEMTTPTGAALVAELAQQFGPIPEMKIDRIGYGAGSRNLVQRPNLLRILVGEAQPDTCTRGELESICILESNLDDISAEQIGFAIEKLRLEGALEVFTSPVFMKKDRPGVVLTVLGRVGDQTRLESILLNHTRTLGVRTRIQSRRVVPRTSMEITTPWGLIRGKVAWPNTRSAEFSPEYDDCRQIALEHGLRWDEVYQRAIQAFQKLPQALTAPSIRDDHSHDHSHDHGPSKRDEGQDGP